MLLRSYQNMELPWLRWWDLSGKLLATPDEKIGKLAAKLRELGIDPENID